MKGDSVVADGVSVVESRAFQSFVVKILSNTSQTKQIAIPRAIVRHLRIELEDLIEVAVRKVTREYAKEAYGITFFSFKTKCPRCGEIGTLSKCYRHYLVLHHRKGVKGKVNIHYVSPKQASKLIAEHEKLEEAQA